MNDAERELLFWQHEAGRWKVNFFALLFVIVNLAIGFAADRWIW